MKVLEKLMLVLCIFLLLGTGSAMALDYGINITIPDNNNSSSSAWYGNHEDQEVEPGMVATQVWDLEGFFLKGNTLSVVGGYNFQTGQDGFMAGDIFIDVNGDAVYGGSGTGTGVLGNNMIQSTFGYEYVFALDMDTSTYNVYQLDSLDYTITSYYAQNQGSDPWRYGSGGESLLSNQAFTFTSGLTNTETDLSGDTHYAITGFDLSFLAPGTTFTAHTTMQCGNDNLMGSGQTAPVPEPATMLLLGSGLMGLAGVGRKKLFKK